MERRLAAILAADVVGYSRLMEQDEVGTFERLRDHRKELFEPKIEEYHGRVFKLMGDGMLAEFASVVDALECAVALQQGMAKRNDGLTDGQRIDVRMGINLGDVIVEGEDRHGEGVNIAARLQQLAEPGGIAVSRTVVEHVNRKLALQFESLGEHQVKNIVQPVHVYLVRLDVVPLQPGLKVRPVRVGRWQWSLAAAVVALLFAGGALWVLADREQTQLRPLRDKPAVAVLPFSNYTGDEATRRLADGLTEDIITDLAHFPELDVVARNSTDVYKDKPSDVRKIGEALNVGYVMEGSIQREAGRVRITAQLVDAKTGNHLWSERWDRPDDDVFAIQTEISDQVSNRLGGGAGLIQEAGRIAAHRKPPENLTAYELYLLGTEKLEKFDRADIEEAIRFLTHAVELDPRLARAWVELFHAHSLMTGYGGDPESEGKAAADAAERAVTLDPADAEAHAVHGMSIGAKGDFAGAKAELDKALSLAPGSAEILSFYAGWASTFGEPERGAELVDQVIRLDPSYPKWDSGIFAYAYFMAGRYEDTLRTLDRLTPENYNMWNWTFRCGGLGSLGRTKEAEACVKEALTHYSDLTIEAMANDPGFSDPEHKRMVEAMRLAGFPACAKPEQLAKFAKPLRLPECQTKP